MSRRIIPVIIALFFASLPSIHAAVRLNATCASPCESLRVEVISTAVTTGTLSLYDMDRPVSERVALYLPAGASVTAFIQAPREADVHLYRLVFTADNHDDAVLLVPLSADSAGILKWEDYERHMNAVFAAREDAQAETAAAEAYGRAIGKHKHPALIQNPRSRFDEAWNTLVQRNSNAQKTRGAMTVTDCGTFTLSPDTVSCPLQGTVSYYEPTGGIYTYFRSSGFLVTVITSVDYEDLCGNVQPHQLTYGATLDAYSQFYLSTILTASDPQTINPVQSFRMIAPSVGTHSGANSTITLPQQYMGPSAYTYSWSNNRANIFPKWSQNTSTYWHMWPWADELKYMKTAVFSSLSTSATDFHVGADSNESLTRFCNGTCTGGDGGGLVLYDPTDGFTKWTMAHELGHNLQFNLSGHSALSSFGYSHDICQSLADYEYSFYEGFADWVGTFCETAGRPNEIVCISGECTTSCVNTGYSNEGNVMKYFWDIFDGVNSTTYDSSQDTMAKSTSFLSNWAQTNYTSFQAFYDSFTSRGLWGSDATAANALRTVDSVTVP